MTILLLLLLLLLVRRFLFMTVRVKGSSMLPTLKNGDILLVSRLLKGKQPFKRGDVVICHYPGRYLWKNRLPMLFVKRVVGLPGEWLEIDHETLLINDAPVEEPYLDMAYAHGRGITRRRRIGRHRYFVMGDHRDCSHDSRTLGAIWRGHMVGKVIGVIRIPLKLSKWLERVDRKLEKWLKQR